MTKPEIPPTERTGTIGQILRLCLECDGILGEMAAVTHTEFDAVLVGVFLGIAVRRVGADERLRDTLKTFYGFYVFSSLLYYAKSIAQQNLIFKKGYLKISLKRPNTSPPSPHKTADPLR